jgi:hypothetical protein
MATPSGYSSSNLVMDDTFQGTTLNSRWSTTSGGPTGGAWYDCPNAANSAHVVVNNGLTLVNSGNGADGCINTYNTQTGAHGFTFPSGGFYLQVNFKVSDLGNGFWPAIWFPWDNCGAAPNPNCTPPHGEEMDVFEGGMLGSPGCTSASSVNDCVEYNYGGAGSSYSQWDQGFHNVGYNITQNFVTIGYEWVPGSHVNVYVGQGANRQLVLSDTNAPSIGSFSNYNLMLTPHGAPCSGNGSNGWHLCGTGTGSMYVAEVQVYSLP